MLKRALGLVALVGLVACAEVPAGEEEAGETGSAATADARLKLEAYTGTWHVAEDNSAVQVFPDAVTITVADDEVDPTTKETKGTRLRLMRAGDATVPAIDRAPFVNVDEGKGCESVRMEGLERLSVCHETSLSSDGSELRHTVTLTSYQVFVFPTGWSKATQTMKLSGGKLRYTYEIDGEPSTDVILTR